MRIGYLGPEGTFSHEALLTHGAGVDGYEAVPLPTIHDVVMAVHDGTVARAIAPIENSLDGSVNATLDVLLDEAPDVALIGEAVQPVRHCLLAAAPVALEELEAVVSHPQGNAQCARFLRTALPAAHVISAPSTADAVRRVAREPPPDGARRWAAIGTATAGRLYGCSVLREGIEDDPGNSTRFVWIGPRGAEPIGPAAPGAAWKTSLAFQGAGDESAGWLVRCLSELAFRGVNLTRIESRPTRRGLGHYRFFIDLDGHAEREPARAAIEGLRSQAGWVRVLGSYPAGSNRAASPFTSASPLGGGR